MPFNFYPPGELQTSFQGYQGPDPATSQLIFLGKDANFPQIDPIADADLLDRLCRFLAGHEWRDGALFRITALYENRNDHPGRAHHQFLLSDFFGNSGGARYHSRIAQLLDRMMSWLHQHYRFDLEANLVGQHCSFVELIRFATTGNNGNCLSRVLRGGLPPDPQNVPINFHIGQQTHRTVTLRRWLINAGGPKHHPVVVISKSIFKVLCEHAVNQQTGWLNLSPEHWRQAQEWFAEEGHIYPLPGFGDRDWIITAGFPYFRGWEGQAIEDCLHDLAEMLGQRLIRFH